MTLVLQSGYAEGGSLEVPCWAVPAQNECKAMPGDERVGATCDPMTGQQTLCVYACGFVGALGCFVSGAACTIGTVATVGDMAIPCIYLVGIAFGAYGGTTAVCCTRCME